MNLHQLDWEDMSSGERTIHSIIFIPISYWMLYLSIYLCYQLLYAYIGTHTVSFISVHSSCAIIFIHLWLSCESSPGILCDPTAIIHFTRQYFLCSFDLYYATHLACITIRVWLSHIFIHRSVQVKLCMMLIASFIFLSISFVFLVFTYSFF